MKIKASIFLTFFVLFSAVASELHLSHKGRLVSFWTDYFTKKSRSLFLDHVKNGDQYQAIVTKILEAHDLPADLFYVALIESGFNSKIRSRAGAVGPWQFMPATGRRYGLRIDSSVDERMNIYKATHAAAGYFKDLYNIFGSWELALCAYNAGEFKIIRAIRKGNERNYQKLVDKKLLPKETVYYIPKVMAARKILKNRSRYGIAANYAEKADQRFYLNAEKKRVHGSFQLRALARKWGVSYSNLKKLNPDIRHQKVRARRYFDLYLPGKTELKVAKDEPPKEVPLSEHYVVKKGDTLIGLSHRFGLSLRDIVEANSIVKYRIYSGQRLILKKVVPSKKVYVVRKGDNLHRIAKRFGITIKELRQHNSQVRNRIYPRQELIIPKRI